MKKKLLSLVCAITCALTLGACGSVTETTDVEKSLMSTCEMYASYTYQLVSVIPSDYASELTGNYNKEELAEIYYEFMYQNFSVPAKAELGAFNGLLTTYNEAVERMGGITGTGDFSSTVSGDEIIVTLPLYGVNCDGEIEFTYSNDIFTRLQEADCEANTTLSQKLSEAGSHMGDAALNTVLGMGTTFVMLIVISYLVQAFEPIFGSKKKKAEAKPVEAALAAPVAAPAPVESVELSDDTELVAVITAAISAYEGTSSTDGFVVRSIKKANRRN